MPRKPKTPPAELPTIPAELLEQRHGRLDRVHQLGHR
ncbi:transposase [Pandoraea communis]|uniref:Transposase n=1 Tax=Pandoraea communis TaxID=2508297 RepID=A0A5E4YRC9_9BURK|nr:transposase [Pandoraea communis]